MNLEHRHEPSGRREEDRRLDAIETQLKSLTIEIGRVRTSLGLDFKTLMFDLDSRYMPREELKTVYIPRRELEQQQTQRGDVRRSWQQQLPLILIAGGGWITNLVLVLSHHG